jgi:ABC-type uncharacterized transport system YnjBCD permease subunit
LRILLSKSIPAMNALIGMICTFIASALAFLFGLIYLTRPEFMNYHSMAVQKHWEDLPKEMRTLITALMRALSSGFLAVAFTLTFLQIEYMRHHFHWIALAILITGSILFLGSTYAMLLIRINTKGRPPITIVTIIFVMLVAGYFFNIAG